jgi:hypothetical protein
MKKILLLTLWIFPAFAGPQIIFDISQQDVSHPELIKIDYVLLSNPKSVILRARANGRTYHSIVPDLQVHGSSVYFKDVECAQLKSFGLRIIPTKNCTFVVKSERINYGEMDPEMRDVFRIYLRTPGDRLRSRP